MFRLILKSRKAQNTMEYALIIAVIIGAFTAMQLYVRRGMQLRLKAGVDKAPDYVVNAADNAIVGNVFTVGNETQYEPYYYSKGTYNMDTTTSEGTETGNISQSGAAGGRALTGATTKRTGKQEIKGTDDAD